MYHAREWQPGIITDILLYSDASYAEKLKFLDIGSVSTPESTAMITKLVRVFWDIFAKVGFKRPILGFEFGIDTGSHTHV